MPAAIVRRARKNVLRGRLESFHALLDFANQEFTALNWRDQLLRIMGEEKSCHVTYKTAEKTKREKMLESDIGSNLQVELFGTAVIFDENESARRISEAIIEIEDCLPWIYGKEANLESAQTLRNELRSIFREVSASDLGQPQEQIRLRKKIEKTCGPRGVARDAFIFPDGDTFYKSWLYENDDVRALLFFKLARLLDELCRPCEQKELVILPQMTSRKISLKILNDIIASKIHGEKAQTGDQQARLKLSLCGCGCGCYFLHGERGRMFVDDHHRMKFHNTERTKSGQNREAVRKHRAKKGKS
jgi:hypothetical protein